VASPRGFEPLSPP